MTLPVNAGLYFADLTSNTIDGFLTEHGRQPVSVGGSLIQTAKRTVNGTRRAYVVATKKTFTVSWEMVPADLAYTLDGYKGGNDIINWYESYFNKTFYLYVFNRTAVGKSGVLATDLAAVNSAGERYQVGFSDQPTYDIVKRNVMVQGALGSTSSTGRTDFWNISVALEEV